MRKFLILVCTFLTLSSATVQAAVENAPNALSLSLNVGGYNFGSSEQLNTSPIYSFKLAYDIIGKNISDSLGIEAGVSIAPTQSTKGSKTKVNSYLLRIDALYPFQPRDRIVPYLALGVGGKFLDGPITEQNAVINYGVGIKYYLLEYLAVRSDLRHVLIFDTGKNSGTDLQKNLEYSVGLSLTLDRNKNIIRIPIIDSDKDGVPDKQDLCPKTPRGVKVDKKGCPVDTDNDGVPDFQDKCPDTPKGTIVDKSGCPEVIKPLEITPEPLAIVTPAPPIAPAIKVAPVEPTPPVIAIPEAIIPTAAPVTVPAAEEKPVAPATVKKAVIPAGVRMIFEFDTDKAVVKRKDIEYAIKLWAALKTTANISVTIEGHTDIRGSASYNLKLSRKRAKSIKNFLITSFAIDPAKITIQAFGYYQPIAANTTDDGRQKNRRAVALILEEEE